MSVSVLRVHPYVLSGAHSFPDVSHPVERNVPDSDVHKSPNFDEVMSSRRRPCERGDFPPTSGSADNRRQRKCGARTTRRLYAHHHGSGGVRAGSVVSCTSWIACHFEASRGAVTSPQPSPSCAPFLQQQAHARKEKPRAWEEKLCELRNGTVRALCASRTQRCMGRVLNYVPTTKTLTAPPLSLFFVYSFVVSDMTGLARSLTKVRLPEKAKCVD